MLAVVTAYLHRHGIIISSYLDDCTSYPTNNSPIKKTRPNDKSAKIHTDSGTTIRVHRRPPRFNITLALLPEKRFATIVNLISSIRNSPTLTVHTSATPGPHGNHQISGATRTLTYRLPTGVARNSLQTTQTQSLQSTDEYQHNQTVTTLVGTSKQHDYRNLIFSGPSFHFHHY